MNTFNLSKMNKTAFYDDGRGLVQKQTRAMMNCWKAKMEAGKMGAQEAYMSCVEEYQKSKENDWGLKYASEDNSKMSKKAQLATQPQNAGQSKFVVLVKAEAGEGFDPKVDFVVGEWQALSKNFPKEATVQVQEGTRNFFLYKEDINRVKVFDSAESANSYVQSLQKALESDRKVKRTFKVCSLTENTFNGMYQINFK